MLWQHLPPKPKIVLLPLLREREGKLGRHTVGDTGFTYARARTTGGGGVPYIVLTLPVGSQLLAHVERSISFRDGTSSGRGWGSKWG